MREDRRIYVLGAGNIGTLVAHSLASLTESTRSPITLLLHRQSLLDAWNAKGKTLDLLRFPDGASQPRTGIDVELKVAGSQTRESETPIQNLIVCVLASQVTSALEPLRHRLGPDSSILFLQNGMGSADDAAKALFPDPLTRPTFLIGVVLAGSWQLEPFVVRHAGKAVLPIAIMPHATNPVDADMTSPEPVRKSARHLLDTMLASEVLQTEEMAYPEILLKQLEKLTGNCITNPLTGLLDQRISIVQSPSLEPLIAVMVSEISSIILAMPELQNVPDLHDRFDPQPLLAWYKKASDAVKNNTSSMTQHLRKGRQTEIEYINGYLVRKAEELGVPCPLMLAMRQLILTKEAINMEQKNVGE
jgi:2-dehydropantoate 2-reductase